MPYCYWCVLHAVFVYVDPNFFWILILFLNAFLLIGCCALKSCICIYQLIISHCVELNNYMMNTFALHTCRNNQGAGSGKTNDPKTFNRRQPSSQGVASFYAEKRQGSETWYHTVGICIVTEGQEILVESSKWIYRVVLVLVCLLSSFNKNYRNSHFQSVTEHQLTQICQTCLVAGYGAPWRSHDLVNLSF